MAASPEQRLFICYSHTDQKYREQFSKFLVGRPVKGVEIFSDAQIKPGAKWEEEILKNLKTATAALLLISQDFMVSPFIQRVELRELLEGHIRRGLRLFLVAVRPTNYQGTYLEPFQWARPPDRPLSALGPHEQEQAMVDVCASIAEQLASNFAAPSAEQTIQCLKNIPKLDLPSMYELHAPVGDGEYARCYLARDLLLDRNLIVKVLNTELSRDSPAYDKYVASAARLTHRNILGVLFSQANKLPHFLVTPAVEGPTLDERLAGKNGASRLSFRESVECTMHLADALAYAHRRNCVHGRLRPCEVRFDHENQPVLSGFRTIENCATKGVDDMVTLADFQYCSPERRVSGIIDAKGDQYLLGLLAYEMITGKPPVTITNWAQLLDPAIASGLLRPPPLKSVVPRCNERVSDIIMTMLEEDPSRRLTSLADVRPLLEAAAFSNTYCFEVAKNSYRRCARQTVFYRDLYEELFRTMPEIQGMFKQRSMGEQYKVLADALWLLLDFPDRPERREPTILSGIARTHAKYSPKQFDQFQKAVLKAVARHDPDGRQAVDAWREAMKPGLEYLKARAREAASGRTAGGNPAVQPLGAAKRRVTRTR